MEHVEHFRESFDVVFHLGFKMASRQSDTTEEALDAIFQYFFYMKKENSLLFNILY